MKIAYIVVATFMAEAQDVATWCNDNSALTCGAATFATCKERCDLIKSEKGCKAESKCEWKVQEFMGIQSGSCSSTDSSLSCSGDKADCIQDPECEWLTGTCGLEQRCDPKGCIFLSEQNCTAAAKRCKYEGGFCKTNYDAELGCDKDSITESECSANTDCEWNKDCVDQDPCTHATEAACIADSGCFWMKQQGKMEVEAMGTAETSAVVAECKPCHTDLTKLFSLYQFVTDNSNKGCSISGSATVFGFEVSVAGSIDILGAVPASDGSCAGGEAFSPFDSSLGDVATMESDCSYAVGEAPMGNTSAASRSLHASLVLVGLAAAFW